MVPRHRVLSIVWAMVFTTALIGWISASPALIVVTLFVPMILAIVTFRRVQHEADLVFPKLYYVLVAMLLLSAAGAAILCGRTMFVSRSGPMYVVGLTALGTTNLIIAILAWRALVVPSTRRAAVAGLVAVTTECLAMGFDITVNMHVRGFGDQPETGLALLAALLCIATGSLACFAALVAFGPKLPSVPAARVVDGD